MGLDWIPGAPENHGKVPGKKVKCQICGSAELLGGGVKIILEEVSRASMKGAAGTPVRTAARTHQ